MIISHHFTHYLLFKGNTREFILLRQSLKQSQTLFCTVYKYKSKESKLDRVVAPLIQVEAGVQLTTKPP